MKTILPFLVSAAFFTGCATTDAPAVTTPEPEEKEQTASTEKSADVTPEQFNALYNIPEAQWFFDTRYRETPDYFNIDLYSPQGEIQSQYVQTWRVPKKLMPADFPNAPRQTLAKAESPEEEEKAKETVKKAVAEAEQTGVPALAESLEAAESDSEALIIFLGDFTEEEMREELRQLDEKRAKEKPETAAE